LCDQPEQTGLGTAHGFRLVAILLVEGVATFVQSVDLCSGLVPVESVMLPAMQALPASGICPRRSCSSGCNLQGSCVSAKGLKWIGRALESLDTLDSAGPWMARRIAIDIVFQFTLEKRLIVGFFFDD
jgi:hypothetical protein